jgi:hypothetical protein
MRTTQRSERHVKVANGVQADVEAVGDVHLELVDGFILFLRDVLFIPSLQRNLISMSCLNNDGFDCHFGYGKCEIQCNNECVGLPFQKQDLFLLSLRENVNSVCDANENVSSFVNANRKRKRTQDALSKLWHYRLGHISRGRIERLVKNDILPPLKFLDFERCRECIKRKYTKQIKKDAKRSAGIL